MINGGIDDQIQQRITASGGNPQRLMQAYNQKKELLDLLALQKLKSDKEAAMRNMQMQMQQNPQTVKQQREAELMQMTKDELAANVGKTMQQQQAKSQNNLQRVANQGIATAPAQNMARMAGGGIVNYAAGDLVDADDAVGNERRRYAELLKKARPQGKSFDLARLTEQEKFEFERLNSRFEDTPIQDFLNRPISDIPGMVKQGVAALLPDPKPRPASEIRTIGEGTASGTIEEMNADRSQNTGPAPATVDTRPPIPTEDETDYLDGAAPPAIDQTGGEKPAPSPDTSGIASIVAPVVPSTKRDDIVQSTGQRPADDAFRKSMRDAVTSQIGRDPLAEAQTMRDEAAKYKMFSPEERAGLEGIIAERKALEERRMDPKRLAKERLQSFLLGAQGSDLGSTFRTAGLARESARGRQETAEAQLMQARQQKIEDLINKSRDIRSDVFEAGKPAFEASEKARTSGITAGTGMSDTDLAAQAKAEATASAELRDFATITSNENIANAKIKSQTEIAEAQNETQREANRLRAETNRLGADEMNQTKLEGQLTRAQDVEQKIRTNIADELASDIGLQGLQMEFSTALEEGDAKRAQQLQDAMDIIKQKVYDKYKDQLDDIANQKARINERIDMLQFQVLRR